jgi:hypothetical protein
VSVRYNSDRSDTPHVLVLVVVLVLATLCSLWFVEHEDEDRYAEDEDDLSPYL